MPDGLAAALARARRVRALLGEREREREPPRGGDALLARARAVLIERVEAAAARLPAHRARAGRPEHAAARGPTPPSVAVRSSASASNTALSIDK